MFQLFLLITMMLHITSCQGPSSVSESKQGKDKISGSPVVQASEPVLAFVNDEAVTEEEIEAKMAARLHRARLQLYEAHKAGIDEVLKEKLVDQEAARRGITPDELIKTEVRQKVDITYEAVKQFYDQNKKRFRNRPLSEVDSMIRALLYRQKYPERYLELIKELRAKAKIQYLIEPPYFVVQEDDHPAIGPSDAPVKIIEFADYQCPYCARSRDTVEKVLKEYKGKVRYVFRDFPLPFHREAFKAHEAGHCAQEQGKYWDFNQQLFGNQQALKIKDLKEYAGRLKLDEVKFAKCLDSNRHADKIRRSIRYGKKLGVSGTPAFFINGRLLPGKRPFSAFQEAIDEELGRVD